MTKTTVKPRNPHPDRMPSTTGNTSGDKKIMKKFTKPLILTMCAFLFATTFSACNNEETLDNYSAENIASDSLVLDVQLTSGIFYIDTNRFSAFDIFCDINPKPDADVKFYLYFSLENNSNFATRYNMTFDYGSKKSIGLNKSEVAGKTVYFWIRAVHISDDSRKQETLSPFSSVKTLTFPASENSQ